MKLLLFSHSNEQQKASQKKINQEITISFGWDKLAGKNILELFVKKLEKTALQNGEFFTDVCMAG